MKHLVSLVLSLILLLSATATLANVTQAPTPSVASLVKQTSQELQKVKAMNGTEFELYMTEQAQQLDRFGFHNQAATLRLYADRNIKAEFEKVIEQNLNDSASNGLLIGFAIAGCASIVLCPIFIFLAICTFADLTPASDI